MTIYIPWKTSTAWKRLGEVLVCGERLQFPEELSNLEKKLAGLYCFHCATKDYYYIGQSKRLKERLYEYRKPTRGVLQEHYIHQALIDNRGADLYIFIARGSDTHSLRKMESNEIKLARATGVDLFNRGETLSRYERRLAEEACDELLKDWLKGKKPSSKETEK